MSDDVRGRRDDEGAADERGPDQHGRDDDHGRDGAVGSGGPAAPDDHGQGPPADEAEILRRELGRLQEAMQDAQDELEQQRERVLRARADLENLRRRSTSDVERAREAGLDSAIRPVLTVYDDLGRALQAAESGDPASIVPGVRSVKETLERQLASLGVEPVGAVGERFDPDRHEALTVVPRRERAEPGTIADVFEVGFVRGDRLVRPARVVVFGED